MNEYRPAEEVSRLADRTRDITIRLPRNVPEGDAERCLLFRCIRAVFAKHPLGSLTDDQVSAAVAVLRVILRPASADPRSAGPEE